MWFCVMWVGWFMVCGFGSCFDWFGLVKFGSVVLSGVSCLAS